MRTRAAILLTLCATAAGLCQAGGESLGGFRSSDIPQPRPLAPSPIRPQSLLPRNPPPPAPYRPIGWGFNCHEAYGPTYYYPSVKSYEGLHPQYYPFFHPRLWPNYKTDALAGGQCGASRSCWAWDSYDDWMRGGRYEEKQ